MSSTGAAAAVAAGLSAVAAFAVAWPLPRVLLRRKLIDVPNERSSHAAPTPRGGGWAIALGVLLGGLVGAALTTGALRMVLAVCGVSLACGAIGLADDLRSLPAVVRLAGQLLIGGVAAVLLLNAQSLSVRNTVLPGGAVAAAVVVVLWVLSNVNAVNFMDGINGITAVHSITSGTFLGWLGYRHHLNGVAVAGAALAGASLGFLPHNAPRARLFLGDIGSYLIGCWIAMLTATVWLAGANPLVALAPSALYLADTATTLLRRAFRGDSLFDAHREHAYQRLAVAWGGHMPALSLYGVLQVVVCAAAWGFHTERIAPSGAIVLTLAGLSTYLLAPRASSLQ